MINCWKCGKELVYKKSEEHIIPQALGGKLTSHDLLHKECNQFFGHGIDAELSRQLEHLAFLSNVNRKRSSNKVFKAKDSNNEVVFYDSNRKMYESAVIELDNGEVIELTARNTLELEKKVMKNLNNMEKKGLCNSLAVYENRTFREIDQTHFFTNNSTDIVGYSQVGGRILYQAVCKIAINFAVHSGVSSLFQTDAIEFAIISEMPNFYVRSYSPDYYTPYYPSYDEISHVLSLTADPNQQSIFCYVELFNVECFLVRLSKAYSGELIRKTYKHNLKSGEHKTQDISLLNRPFRFYHDQYTNHYEFEEKISQNNIQERYDRLQLMTLPKIVSGNLVRTPPLH